MWSDYHLQKYIIHQQSLSTVQQTAEDIVDTIVITAPTWLCLWFIERRQIFKQASYSVLDADIENMSVVMLQKPMKRK